MLVKILLHQIVTKRKQYIELFVHRIILVIVFLLTIQFIQAVQYETFYNIRMPYDANVVNCLYQDTYGMVWMGTKRGLYNYNGYDIHPFSKNTIQAILQIGNYLCIGTDDGIWWHNLQTGMSEERFEVLSQIGAVRSLSITDNVLWIGTRDGGLFTFEMDTEELVLKSVSGNKETMIFALSNTQKGMFVGSNVGLSYYQNATHKGRTIKTGCIVYTLYHDGDKLWVGAEGALYLYSIDKGHIEKLLNVDGNAVKTIIKENDRYLLLGTDEGLIVYDELLGLTEKIVHNAGSTYSLCNNVVNDIMCDKHNNLWFATNRGISIAQTQPWYKTTRLSELTALEDGNVFECSLVDSHHNYWLGGENGLIHLSDGKVKWWTVGSGLRHNHIRNIYEDRDGDLWIASDGGIARYDRQQDKFMYYSINDDKGRNSNWAYSIYEDESERLWIGTYMGGLYVVEKKELLRSGGKFRYNNRCFGNDEDKVSTVYKIEPDERGNLWLNTGGGLAYLNVKTFKIEQKDIYLDNMIYVDGAVWLSSFGHLMKYDPQSGKTTELPFPTENSIIHAFVKENHRVWFSCAEGLYYITTHDAMIHSSLAPDGDLFSGAYDRSRNEMVWGGEDELTRFFLDRMDLVNLPDSILVTGISVNGTLITGYNSLKAATILLTKNKNIVFELSTLSFMPQSQVVYYYRLGRNGQWHSLGKGVNKLAFVEMPSGRNLLYLCTTNPNVNTQAHLIEYQIQVPYPWYLSWWSIAIGLILLISCIVGIIRYVQIRNKKKYEEREREKSLEMSRQKMDFFVNVSHELKTPLSLIIAPLSQMISETTNPKQRKSLKAIHTNSLRLNNLIYKILDFKRMEYESEDTLIRSHVEICSLLRSCIQTFTAETEQRHIEILFNPTVDPLWLNVDMLKLESVFVNLISNALKFVPDETGRLEITLESRNNNVTISFADNGKGMDNEDIPMMFVRFFQGKNRSRGGTGIGLYLVRKFVELHEGTVEVHNAGGLSVKISLPINGENAIPYKHSEPELVETDVKEATLLIIDDNKEIVDFLAESLSKTYICLKAYNGVDGKEILEKNVPDLIIVDQMMPQMDGFEFCRWVRHNYPTTNIPLIMLTAKDDTDTELESIKIGVDVFISKPFDMKKVQLHIAQLLKRKRSIEKSVNIKHITNPEFKSEDHRSADEILMENITKAIEDNMEQENFNVSQLAEYLNMDQKQLYRKTKQLTGMTPIAYLKKLRMRKAAVLLKKNRFTVSEVMYLVGYTNASYFSKCFAEEFGVTPKQYSDNDTEIS